MSDRTPKSTAPPAIWLLALSALAAFAAVYVIAGRPDNDRPSLASPENSKTNAQAPAGPGSNTLSTGAMTTFVFKDPRAGLPDIGFLNGAGARVSLKDWRGKVVLLNLWATWCAPCREEMPALDRLQAALGSDRFEVVALAVDKAGLEGARKFLDETKVAKLKLYVDPSARDGTELKVIGMPTSILIDREGREIGRLIGPAAWDSPEAKRLVEAFL